MKNLKRMLGLLVVSTLALVGMTNVHATGVVNKYSHEDASGCMKTNDCPVMIGEHGYKDLSSALEDAIGNSDDVITIQRNLTTADLDKTGNTNELTQGITGKEIKTKVTIDLGRYTVVLGKTAGLVVGKDGDLTIKGAGELSSSTNTGALITVEAEGKLTTTGALKLASAADAVIDNSGTVTIGTGAELAATAGAIVKISAHDSTTTLNSVRVGASNNRSAATLIDTSNVGTALRSQTVASVKINGGSYYTTSNMIDIVDGVKVVIEDGTLNANGGSGVITVTDGTLAINGGTIINVGRAVGITGNSGEVKVTIGGGTIKSTNGYALETEGKVSGSLTVKTGTIKTEKTYSPLHLKNAELTYSVGGGTFEGPKDTPAIYIDDALLTGMAEDGEADPFKAMVTGGKFLYMVIGDARKSYGAPDDYTADQVTKYILGDKLEAKADGNYLVVGNGSGATTDPGTQAGPGDDEPSKSPATFDAIGSLVTIAISSLGVVGTATKKLFR